MKLVTFVLLFGLCQTAVYGCTCASAATCWPFSDEGVHFLGTATGTHFNGFSSVAVDFSVSEGFGKARGLKKVTVQTNSESTACGYPFRMGVEYFVSATGRGSDLWTSSCSQTRPAISATALLRQFRAVAAKKPTAQIFGFIGTEPYPGVSPMSRLESKPVGSISISAVGEAGEFLTASKPDGSFEFSNLSASTYHVRAKLPEDMFIWFAPYVLKREYAVRPGVTCEADLPLYPKGDPFAANQRK